MIRAALVLLAIRALGKCKRILQQLPPSFHRPETVLDSDLLQISVNRFGVIG